MVRNSYVCIPGYTCTVTRCWRFQGVGIPTRVHVFPAAPWHDAHGLERKRVLLSRGHQRAFDSVCFRVFARTRAVPGYSALVRYSHVSMGCGDYPGTGTWQYPSHPHRCANVTSDKLEAFRTRRRAACYQTCSRAGRGRWPGVYPGTREPG